MTKENKIVKPGWKDRLKANWKKLVVAVIGLGTIIYFVVTGEEIDLSAVTGWLQ